MVGVKEKVLKIVVDIDDLIYTFIGNSLINNRSTPNHCCLLLYYCFCSKNVMYHIIFNCDCVVVLPRSKLMLEGV